MGSSVFVHQKVPDMLIGHEFTKNGKRNLARPEFTAEVDSVPKPSPPALRSGAG
jgi:hypothetical protein